MPVLYNTYMFFTKGITGVGRLDGYGKTFCFFENDVPNVMTTDVDLVKNVLIKDSQKYFINRRVIFFNLLMNNTKIKNLKNIDKYFGKDGTIQFISDRCLNHSFV